MKIVFVTGESYIDHSYTIIKWLGRRIDLEVIFIAKEKTVEIREWCEKLNARFVKRKRFRNPFSIFADFRLMMSLRRSEAGQVWFNTMSPYQIFLAKLLLKDFLITVHDVEAHPGQWNVHSSLSLWLTFKILKKNICVTSNTQASSYEAAYGIKPPVFQLPVIDYYQDTAEPDDHRSSYPAKMRFFFFGTIEVYKGIETLLEAAEILVSRKMDFELNIYGKLRYDHEILKQRIESLEAVTLTNEFIDYKHIHKLYSSNDVLVLPYNQVTQCGPLLIAYSECIPVICNDLPGFREYVDPGRSGLIFGGSAEELANKMEEFVNNPQILLKFKDYIKTEVHKKFAMENLCETYIKNFEKSIG